jgi:hypothetical protein
VDIFERWESQAAVEAFRGSGPTDEQGAAIVSASVAEYVVAGVRVLRRRHSKRVCEALTLPGSVGRRSNNVVVFWSRAQRATDGGYRRQQPCQPENSWPNLPDDRSPWRATPGSMTRSVVGKNSATYWTETPISRVISVDTLYSLARSRLMDDLGRSGFPVNSAMTSITTSRTRRVMKVPPIPGTEIRAKRCSGLTSAITGKVWPDAECR